MMLSFHAKIESSHEKRTNLTRLTPCTSIPDWFQQQTHMLRPDIFSFHGHDIEFLHLAVVGHRNHFFTLQIVTQYALKLS